MRAAWTSVVSNCLYFIFALNLLFFGEPSKKYQKSAKLSRFKLLKFYCTYLSQILCPKEEFLYKTGIWDPPDFIQWNMLLAFGKIRFPLSYTNKQNVIFHQLFSVYFSEICTSCQTLNQMSWLVFDLASWTFQSHF